MARKAPFTWEQPYMKCFLEVIVHWRMIIWLMYAMWPVNVKKKNSIEVVRNIPLSNCLKKHQFYWTRNFVFAIYGHFYEIDVFPLGAFSIRNFNLQNFKANELANEWTSTACLCFTFSSNRCIPPICSSLKMSRHKNQSSFQLFSLSSHMFLSHSTLLKFTRY